MIKKHTDDALRSKSRLNPPSWGGGQRYHVFQYKGQDVLAVPSACKSASLEGVKRFHAHTKKRKIYRTAISALVRLGAEPLMAIRREQMIAADFPIDIEAWGQELEISLGQQITHLILAWPAQPSRRRLYMHALDANLQSLAFVKIAFRADHHSMLSIEADALTDLHTCGLQRVRVPNLLGQGRLGGASYLVIEPLPKEIKPLDVTQLWDIKALTSEYRGKPRVLSAVQIMTLSWWTAYIENLLPEHHLFHAELLSLLPLGAQVCRAHGDLGTANLATNGALIWIFDWESHHTSAPVLSDSVSFFLSFEASLIARGRNLLAERFNNEFLIDPSQVRRLEVMLALAYGYASKITGAGPMIAAWRPLHGGVRHT